MNIYRLDRFNENYKKVDENIKKAIRTKLRLMAENPFHPSLRTKKVQCTQSIFEASINTGYRITWEYYQDGILLRNIGEHDETLKNP
jgi:mRNA interferase RelE/StbE